jgi:hypothetical protein
MDACLTKSKNCTITIDELLKDSSVRVFQIKGSSGEMISEFRDKGKDSLIAGYYSFYGNGHLRYYKFFSTLNDYVYNEEYNDIGNLIKKEGNPLVHKCIKRVSQDSISIDIYFFSMNKSYEKLHVKTMNNKLLNLQLKKDTLYSNTTCASFGVNFKGYKDIDIYLYSTQ